MSDTLGSAVTISGMQNSISQLPEEIVDIILRQLCSPDQVSAGSVCRRWYNITLPYLWHSIEVSGSDGDQHLRRPESFLSVLTGNPVVGSLIHRLTFHHVQLDIPLVSRILALLPQLRYLNLAWIALHPFDDTTQPPSGWHGHGRFSLDELRLTYNPFRRYGVYDIAEVQLLSLFSRIDALFYDCSQHTQTTPTTPDALLAVVTPACRLSVDELFIEFGPILPSHIRLLLQCHALHNLTCLNLTGADLEGLQDIGHFLCIAGEPLVELILNLDWDLNTDGFNPSWDAASASDHSVLRREFARDAMRKGLEKCINLHAFRFRMRTVAPAAIDYDLPVLLEIAAQGWIMALDIVALVHPGDSKGRLRHLALEYWNIVFSRWSCRWDVDFQSYHWARVRSICRRFEGLRSLGIEFCKRGPGTSTVGIFRDEIEQELQVFKDVYSPHWEFWTCEEPSCRIYAQTH